MTKIAIIGLGAMGLPLAGNLVRHGADVVGIDTCEKARAAFTGADGVAARPGTGVLANRDVILTMLPQGAHVTAVFEEHILPGAAPNTLLIDCSTIDVTTARDLAARARAQGLAMIDAPVSGGPLAARDGTLSLMVGGADEAINRALPVLEKIAARITRFGPAGSGQAAKACHNMICGITAMAVIEGFALADALELDLEKFYGLCASAAAQSWTLENRCPIPGIVADAPSSNGFAPGFAARLMAKDLRLAQAAAEALDQETPLGAMAARLFSEFAAAGHGEKDFSAYYTVLRALDEPER